MLLPQQMMLPNFWSSVLSLIDKFFRLQLVQPDAVCARHSMTDNSDPSLVLPVFTVKPMTAHDDVACSLVLLAARFIHQQHNQVTMLLPQDTAFAARILRLLTVLLDQDHARPLAGVVVMILTCVAQLLPGAVMNLDQKHNAAVQTGRKCHLYIGQQ